MALKSSAHLRRPWYRLEAHSGNCVPSVRLAVAAALGADRPTFQSMAWQRSGPGPVLRGYTPRCLGGVSQARRHPRPAGFRRDCPGLVGVRDRFDANGGSSPLRCNAHGRPVHVPGMSGRISSHQGKGRAGSLSAFCGLEAWHGSGPTSSGPRNVTRTSQGWPGSGAFRRPSGPRRLVLLHRRTASRPARSSALHALSPLLMHDQDAFRVSFVLRHRRCHDAKTAVAL